MERIIIFAVLSVPVIIISRRALFNLKSHGFYRFLSWECIAWLFASNWSYWFEKPFSMTQIFSWILLIVSGVFVIAGTVQLKSKGKQLNTRNDKELYEFEKTSELVDTGIYRYIRHPMYSSLLFLTWSIFLKNSDGFLLAVSILSSVFLFFTAVFDEKECVNYFGEKYSGYMKRSKRFIPFVF